MKIHPTEGYKIAFPTDEHHPFADHEARSVALQIVRDFEPDLLIAGSDGVDFYSISKFDKDPKRKFDVQDEIDAWKQGQREWNDAAGDARKVFVPGNHEDRLRRWTWRHPDMIGLDSLAFHKVMGFEDLDLEYEEETIGENYARTEIEVGPLVIKHGSVIRKHSAYTARGEMEKEFYSVPVLFTGHTHRAGAHYAQTRNGMVRAFECFCLCDTDPHYVQSPNWHQGIALATIYGTLVQVEPVPISETSTGKAAVWRDKLYRSE